MIDVTGASRSVAREAAIDATAALAATASDARSVARAFATYRWIEAIADEGFAVAETVAGSIDG